MGRNFLIGLTIAFVTANSCFSDEEQKAGWIDRKAEGWVWYEDRLQKEERSEKEKDKTTSRVESYKERLENARKIIEERLAKAILEPTEENIISYLKAQKAAVEKASAFHEAATRVLVMHPEIGYAAQIPVSHYGTKWKRKEENFLRKSSVQKISERYGLFVFYQGDHPSCSDLAKILTILQEEYDWDVSTIAVDGHPSEGMPNSVSGSSALINHFLVRATPSFFLLDPSTGEVIPVGAGLLSADQLEANIQIVMDGKNDA